MALYNQNFKAVNLLSGNTYTAGDLGNGLTASTVHQIFCLSDGSIKITAIGGGTFTWAASTSDYIDVIVGQCTVNSGEFVGFKAQMGWVPFRG